MTFEFFGKSLWSPQQNLKTKTGQVAHILEYCHGDTIFDIGMCVFFFCHSFTIIIKMPLATKPYFLLLVARGRS